MDLWQDQWMKMEAHIVKEAKSAQIDLENWSISTSTFPREYLDGLTDGLARAALLIEAFRNRMAKSELERQVNDMREFSLDEEW